MLARIKRRLRESWRHHRRDGSACAGAPPPECRDSTSGGVCCGGPTARQVHL